MDGRAIKKADGGISYSGDFSTPDYYQVYNALPNAGLAGQLVQRMFPNPSTTGAYTAYMNQLASSALPPPAPNPTPFVTNVPNVSGPPVPLMPTSNFNFSQFGLGSNAAPALNALAAQQSALALPKMVQPENKAHGGEVDAALHAVRHHLAGGGFLSDLFSGPDYLSTGEVASPTNWGDPELASDFFKADKALRLAREVQGKADDVTGSIPARAPLTAPRPGKVEERELPAPPVNIPFAAPERGVSMLSSDISPESVTSLPLAYAPTPVAAPAAAAIDQATGKLTARIPDEPHGTALTKQQADYITRTIAAETSGKSPEETQAIASVILNRINSGKYGSSPEAVLFAKRQFEPWMNPAGANYPMKISPTSQRYIDARTALEAALAGEDITGGATHFWGPKAQEALGRNPPSWSYKAPGVDIGETRFHKLERAEGGEVEGYDGGGLVARALRAWHGSPYKFNKFDSTKIGTGEGQQLYGKGTYLAEDKSRALEFVGNPEDRYRRFSGQMSPKEELAFDIANQPNARDMDIMTALVRKYGDNVTFDEAMALASDAMKKRGTLYEVDINQPKNQFLHWQKPLSQQSPEIQKILTPEGLGLREAILPGGKNYAWVDETGMPVGRAQTMRMPDAPFSPELTGDRIYSMIGRHDPDRATGMLRDAGVAGNTYVDPKGFGLSSAPHNYVVFNPERDVDILNQYADGGMVDDALRVVREHHADGEAVGKAPVATDNSERVRAAEDAARLAKQIQAYEASMASIRQQPQDIQSMTHAPEKPRAPISIEALGKNREFGSAPYDVAAPLSSLAQGAYDLKTMPLYAAGAAFPPAAALGTAIDTAEGVASGSPTQVAMGALGGPLKVARNVIAPLAVATGVTAPDEAEAANVLKALKIAKIAVPEIAPRKMTLQEVRRTFDPHAGVGMSGEDLDRLIGAYGKVASPASLDPELARKGEEIAQTYITKTGSGYGGRSFFGHKPSVPIEDLGRVGEPVPYTHEPKATVEKSWQDVGRERAGSPLISLGGDLSDLVRLRAYGPSGNLRALANPTDIHAGFDYMLEPNLHSVWSNNPEHAGMLEKQILDQKEIQRAVKKDLPVMAVANPMGPGAIDSAKNMMDLYLNAVEGAGIHPENLKAAAADIRSGKFGNSPKEKEKLQKKLADFPGFDDMDKARDFLLNNPDVAGTTRSAIIKGMEREGWVKKGFPEVGQLRVAASSPKFMMAPGNMMGGRMVELDPRMFHQAEANRYFTHFTYGGDTPGTYYADVPLIHRQYGAPDVTDMLMSKYNQWRPGATKSAPPKAPITVHPFSLDQGGRDTWRKMFEEQRMVQPINERMMESIQRGEQRRPMYGFNEGGSVEDRALMLVSRQA